MTSTFDEYRAQKERHGGRTDKNVPWIGWIVLTVLVALNGPAWYFAFHGYQKSLEPSKPPGLAKQVKASGNKQSRSPGLKPGLILRNRQPNEMALAFLDVGQGDAIFMQTPHGKNILVDSGEGSNPDFKYARKVDAANKLILPFFKRNKIEHLDYFITSHPHSDHIGSSYEIIKNMSIGQVWAAGYDHPSTSKKDMLKAIQQKKSTSGIKFKVPTGAAGTLKPGMALDLGEQVKGWLIRTAPHAENVNQASLVLLFYYGETGVLLTGDTERAGEKELIRQWGDQLDVDILKVGHHGSRTSSIQPFIELVNPKHSVIMVGHYNTFGHPTDEVMSRLRRYGSRVHRTDKKGTIYMFLDGSEISIRSRPSVSAVND